MPSPSRGLKLCCCLCLYILAPGRENAFPVTGIETSVLVLRIGLAQWRENAFPVTGIET